MPVPFAKYTTFRVSFFPKLWNKDRIECEMQVIYWPIVCSWWVSCANFVAGIPITFFSITKCINYGNSSFPNDSAPRWLRRSMNKPSVRRDFPHYGCKEGFHSFHSTFKHFSFLLLIHGFKKVKTNRSINSLFQSELKCVMNDYLILLLCAYTMWQ